MTGVSYVAGGDSIIVASKDAGTSWSTEFRGEGLFLHAVAWGGGSILTSPDGRHWTEQAFKTPHTLLALIRAGTRWEGTVLTSADGRRWTARTFGFSQTLYYVTSDGTRFVAVGWHGAILRSWGTKTPALP
jgi:photosystem II stability/assembly factor-like uncharacterized protein